MKHGDRYRTTGTIGYEYDDTVIKKKIKIREENINFFLIISYVILRIYRNSK